MGIVFFHFTIARLFSEPDSMSYAIDVNLTAEELAQDFLDFNDILKSDEYKKYYGMTKLYGDDTSHSNEKDYLTTSVTTPNAFKQYLIRYLERITKYSLVLSPVTVHNKV